MGALFHTLGIDWRLLAAQIVNFSILALLLTRFFYRPMLQLLDERRAKAAATEETAREVAEAKRELEQERENERLRIKEETDHLLGEARQRAEDMRAATLKKAADEAVLLRQHAEREALHERERLFAESRKELAGLVILAAEKVLERKVNAADTRRLAEEAVAALEK